MKQANMIGNETEALNGIDGTLRLIDLNAGKVGGGKRLWSFFYRTRRA